MTPFVFIVGCARSGTTLLQRIVESHPQIAITPEMHWITDYFRERKWLAPEGRVTPAQVASMIEHKRFRQFEFNAREFEDLLGPDRSVSYAGFLQGIFALYARNKGKPTVGNKTPAFVRRIPTLHGIWPEAKFVHLIRDGRDVCLSVLNWNHAYRTAGRYATWSDDPVSTTALWWKRKVQLGREGGRPLAPELYFEIRYEALVNRPEEECAKLCDFLGVAYDERMLRFHEGRIRTEPGLDAKQAWLPITPGLRNWRTQLPSENVERFEAVAGDLLDELEYPRACGSPSSESVRQATRIHERFTLDSHARNEALPLGW
jgi:hypothetical protein